MFRFKALQRKHARLNSPSASPLRRRQRIAALVILCWIVTCVVLIARQGPASALGRLNSASSPPEEPAGLGHPDGPGRRDPAVPPVRAAQDQTPGGEEAVGGGDASEGVRPQREETAGRSSAQDGADPAERGRWAGRDQFEDCLGRLMSALPGEMHMRELLRPVEGSGKAKLRELGLRVRAFRRYFEVWEALHVHEEAGGGAVVRDDVVRMLRATAVDERALGGGAALGSAVRAYEQFRHFLAAFTQLLFPWNYPFFPDLVQLKASFARGGRGIVLTAGDRQAHYLLATIPSFRALGCVLPIEVLYLGDADLGEDYRARLEALPGVVTRDLAQMVRDDGWALRGWAAKPFAMLYSSFREVLFVDADSAFLEDPTALFDDPDYRRSGALFFRDRLIMPEDKKQFLKDILPRPVSAQAQRSRLWTGESGHQQESGVVVVDKWRHFVALLLVTRMNGPDRDGDKGEGRTGVYELVYGDKETFWLGWELAGDLDYAFHAGDAGSMGTLEGSRDANETSASTEVAAEGDSQPQPVDRRDAPREYTICSPQLLHMGLDGSPLWFNGWLLKSKFASEDKKVFATFSEFVVEPRGRRNPSAWKLQRGNVACLTSDPESYHKLEHRHIQLLDGLKHRAKEVGALAYE